MYVSICSFALMLGGDFGMVAQSTNCPWPRKAKRDAHQVYAVVVVAVVLHMMHARSELCIAELQNSVGVRPTAYSHIYKY